MLSMASPGVASDPIKLPACERCRLRKVRCDSRPPKCSHCVRSSTACIIVDPVTNERYTRDGIAHLEQRLRELEKGGGPPSARSPSTVENTKGLRTPYVGDGRWVIYFTLDQESYRAHPSLDGYSLCLPCPWLLLTLDSVASSSTSDSRPARKPVCLPMMHRQAFYISLRLTAQALHLMPYRQ